MNGDLENLGERIAELAAHLDAATHRLLTDLREFDIRGGWHAQGAISCAHWLAWRVGWDLVTARERVRVARKLADFPAIDDALRRGQLSYSKVRALLRIATPANEAMVLEQARLTTAAQLEKLTRKYAVVQRHGQDRRPDDDEPRRYVRRRDTDDGMVKIEAVLHPEEAELVWAMLDHAAKQLANERHDPAVTHDTVRVAAGCFNADSAESHVPTHSIAIALSSSAPVVEPAPDTRPTASMASSCSHPETVASNADSAESCVALGPIAAPVSPPSTTVLLGSDAVATASVPLWCVQASTERLDMAADGPAAPGFWNGDSAESGVAIVAPCSAETALAYDCMEAPLSVHAAEMAVGLEDAGRDSAESAVAIAAACAAEAVPAYPYVEAPVPVQATEVAVGSGARSGDSAESAAPDRPLLDRLLDEAEAAGAHDSMHHVDDVVRPPATASSIEVPAAEPGMLSRRVDATRRAFQRADALISIAQAYLRGDRPQRAPIDVTVTIPVSKSLQRVRPGRAIVHCLASASPHLAHEPSPPREMTPHL